ncbi:hypothetical protein F8279_29770 [Micromonospora sp. AMSO1212t]|uniref:hypothetical protein n=1 Tax=Micromonospora TaxID=1873 RepID=UPI001112D271|nr:MULTISPECIES: hypothetical protein [Micromonospora]KAB1899953.1 hypothetical protein F8279_29770 [Micromonospora sp. AMSO1212t]
MLGAPTTGVAEPETGAPASGMPGAGAPETGLLESGVPETGAPAAGLAEAGTPEVESEGVPTVGPAGTRDV